MLRGEHTMELSQNQVLWVTMDDVAFDFMDAMAPGCTAMFPFDGSVSYKNRRMTKWSGYITEKSVGGCRAKISDS